MKYSVRITIAVFAMFVAVSGLALPMAAQSAELSPEKLEIIRTNCRAAQSSIQRTQKSDIVTRTNRGRSYEYILQLMASLNSRIALNKLNQPRMVAVTSELQTKFNQFYGHYTEYEAGVDQILRQRCNENPAEFYKSLQELRVKRAQLTQDITEMRQLIDEYDQLVLQLHATVPN